MKKKIKAFVVSITSLGILINYAGILFWQFISGITKGTIPQINLNISYAINTICNNISNPFFGCYVLALNIIIVILTLIPMLENKKGEIYSTKNMIITDKISIPVAAGNGQHGNHHFMTMEDILNIKELDCFRYGRETDRPRKGGFVVGIRAMGSIPAMGSVEEILYIGQDRHVLLSGATRCGKTRRMILESIWLTVLAGENLFITDLKGELWAYTEEFAKAHGYQCVVYDFREPKKGNCYNFLHEISNAIKRDDVAEAIDLTWDLVAVLVGEPKGEMIWHNGECAAIAAVILIVVTEAPEEYRNLTNVYYFLANMAKPGEFGEMPITKYLSGLPETHPARAVFAMAEIAHVRTRGSFFSSALGTLRHFTNPNIADMTSKTDYSFEDLASKKTIIYFILPDEKTTLYGMASIFIMQFYIFLIKIAYRNGDRCLIDWWFLLDEFGQLPFIPPIPQFLSVGAGRGIRLALVLQNFQQLEKKYKDDYNTIKNNCECWIFLKGSEEKTLKEFSEKCGTYTIQVNSTNFNMKSKNLSSDSHTAGLTGRKLLLPEEVGLIEAPYSLICFAGKYPIMLISPDLSFYHMNQEMGLGDEIHNQKVKQMRHAGREERVIGDIKLWGIWNEYKILDEEFEDVNGDISDQGKISFL